MSPAQVPSQKVEAKPASKAAEVPLEENKVDLKDEDKDWHTFSENDDNKDDFKLLQAEVKKAVDKPMPDLVQEQIYEE